MGNFPRLLSVLAVTALLTLALASCGESGESGTTAPEATVQEQDAGGGSAQFRIEGGDNSVQNFGAEASASEFDEATAALHGFLDARATGDWATACRYLAVTVTESLERASAQSPQSQGKGCPELLGTLSASVPESVREEAAEADVGSLRIEGDSAFLLYRGAENAVYAMPMKKEGGRWKVASLAGAQLS